MEHVEPLTSDLALTKMFEAEYLIANRIFPLAVGDVLRVATAGEPDADILQDLSLIYDRDVELVTVSDDALVGAVTKLFSHQDPMVELIDSVDDVAGVDDFLEDEGIAADARDLVNQPPVIRYVNLIIKEAYSARASDIHLEATPSGLVVRLRIDGVLTEASAPPRPLQRAVISRIKLLAAVDIAERRRPQDGRVRVRLEDREFDLRVATTPTLHGESVVLRLLDRSGRPVGLDDLGMRSEILQLFSARTSRPHGIVLATGPTGSGKTTTLYAALGLRNVATEKVITVEDPVEYQLNGITQVPVNVKAGVTFAAALRSLLRQDPDVLMIGETRDTETARIAVQAAMTGHLVLSTLHTNDAVSALVRLIDLGVEPYMVAASVESVLAQRLVRTICPHCRVRYQPPSERLAAIAPVYAEGLTMERGAGCSDCRYTGYVGRTGVFELLVMTDELRATLIKNPDITALRTVARNGGMESLKEDAWRAVRAGKTTVEEVLRVIQE